MKAEVRRALDVIDGVLVRGDDAATELWAILTALRGPDSEALQHHNITVPSGIATGKDGDIDEDRQIKVKSATTSRIRGIAFPKTRTVACRGQIDIGAYMGDGGDPVMLDPDIELPESDGADHFANHTNSAVRAIKSGEEDSFIYTW